MWTNASSPGPNCPLMISNLSDLFVYDVPTSGEFLK